jgi:anti-anti-sigma factor
VTDSHISRLHVLRLPGQQGLRVIGEVDLNTRETWRSALESVAASRAPTRLELSQLSFIDTHGTAMLIAAAQHRPETAPLTLTRPPTTRRRVLTLLCPDKPAKIVIEEQEAS